LPFNEILKMLFTATHEATEHHHGVVHSVNTRDQHPFARRIPCLVPTAEVLAIVDPAEFRKAYFNLLHQRQEVVEQWLATLKPEVDYTVASLASDAPEWRSLVGALVAKKRPDCWGGSDLPFIQH
jgi:hypothetical protein